MFDMKLYEEKMANLEINSCMLCQNISDKPYIGWNKDTEFDNPDDFFLIDGRYMGGNVIAFPGDLVCNWISDKTILGDFVQEVALYLMKKSLPIYGDGNDIMANGKKLFGTMSTPYNGTYYEGMFLSFNPNIETIKKICKKEMKKEPIGLAEFGIVPEEMIELCQRLIKQFGMKEVK